MALQAGLNYSELSEKSRFIHPADAVSLVRRIRQNRYDIIMGFGLRVSLLLRMLRPFLGAIPILIGLRGLDGWRRWYHVWPARLTQFACDLFVPNSDAVAQCRMKREKTPRRKIVVIKNGIDVDYFDKQRCLAIQRKQIGLPEDKLLVTTVGNFRYQKGHDFLLDVIEAFSCQLQAVHFIWAGEGPLRETLEQKISSIGATEKITFLGHVEDVRSVLACSDILVVPSQEEGMPRCLLEAMSMSLPCVATNVGGTPEVIEQGISGLLSDFGDIESFGNNLKRLVDSADLRRKLATAARKRIVSHFSIETVANKYVKLFELVAAGQRDGEKIQQILAH